MVKDCHSRNSPKRTAFLGHGMHQPFETMFEDVFEELPWHLQGTDARRRSPKKEAAKFGPK